MAEIEAGYAASIAVALQRILVKGSAPANGDFNGQAEKGQACVDYSTGIWYANTGTKAATVWTKIGVQV